MYLPLGQPLKKNRRYWQLPPASREVLRSGSLRVTSLPVRKQTGLNDIPMLKTYRDEKLRGCTWKNAGRQHTLWRTRRDICIAETAVLNRSVWVADSFRINSILWSRVSLPGNLSSTPRVFYPRVIHSSHHSIKGALLHSACWRRHSCVSVSHQITQAGVKMQCDGIQPGSECRSSSQFLDAFVQTHLFYVDRTGGRLHGYFTFAGK